MMGGWLRSSIDRGIKAGVEQGVKNFVEGGGLDDAIRKVLAGPRFEWLRFVKHMQARLVEADPSMSDKRSFYMARDNYLAFLKDEGIEFGDPAYDWSRDGARTLIEEMEISYWEHSHDA